ncbi:hypothetical protein NLJ89_g12348 [Agrocybe chaxingu]|uniref:Uncharacterized protein n=1 Tax=Agrocybe chaxingu TaxID=84603 RepID=A0A9W8JM12_9AGAR|nr:hypothetical protein NLJ89_g12348 [Agrocybe chaxingu]
MSPPKHDLVVADCDEALKLDPKYVKALNRRAIALEGLERYREALRDFTAATILDRFQNQTTANAVERVLKVVATKEAKETLENREPRLPSYTFISAYFAAFRPRTSFLLPLLPILFFLPLPPPPASSCLPNPLSPKPLSPHLI